MTRLRNGQRKTVSKLNTYDCLNLGKNPNDLDAILKEPAFKKLVLDDMIRVGVENKISGLEKPKDITLTLDTFSVENNILTPTFKLKRNVARDVYKTQIDAMYSVL